MKKDTIIEAGINAIPYVGGAVATLYFGNKNEKRFERLEEFYHKLREEFESTDQKDFQFNESNSEQFQDLINIIHDKVESESRETKKKLLRNFFTSTIQTPMNGDFDLRLTFLNSLDNMSEFDCNIIAFLKTQDKIQIKAITGSDPYLIFSSVSKLISLGFLETRRGSYTMNGAQDENLDNIVFISKLGKQFIEYVKI
jgi:hypothetical protein